MVVNEYKLTGFSILSLSSGCMFVKTAHLTYRINGINNNSTQLRVIQEKLSRQEVGSLSDLVSLFYIEEDEWTKKKVLEMSPARLEYYV